jgi:hypothetical protein
MPSLSNYEEFKKFQEAVVPELLSNGWTYDDDGPKIPNPLGRGLPPIRLRLRSPAGLYYGLKDAVRVAVGDQPRRAGIPKLSSFQTNAILRYLYDPENASSIVEDCREFPDDEESFSGYRRAVEVFIENLREKVDR